MKKQEINLIDFAKRLLKFKKITNASLDVFVVSNAEMEEIRERLKAMPQFKGAEAKKIRHEPEINVLAFPAEGGFPEGKKGKKTLGEIYVNRDWAKGDAGMMGYLLIHGFLHLLGYRHMKKSDRIIMEQEEKKLCGYFDISFPFP